MVKNLTEDGMDQSKWALPRHRLLQASKEAAIHVRPRMKIHAVWVHGIALNLYLVHPGVPADSSLIVEAFLRSLEDARELFSVPRRRCQKKFLYMHCSCK